MYKLVIAFVKRGINSHTGYIAEDANHLKSDACLYYAVSTSNIYQENFCSKTSTNPGSLSHWTTIISINLGQQRLIEPITILW